MGPEEEVTHNYCRFAMKKENLLLRLLCILLLLAMLATIFLGGERSRHGYGAVIYLPNSRSALEDREPTHLPPPDPSLHIVDLGITLPGQIRRHLGAA